MRGVVKCVVGKLGGGWCVVGAIGLRVDEEREFLGAADRGFYISRAGGVRLRQLEGLKHLHGSPGVLICVAIYGCW